MGRRDARDGRSVRAFVLLSASRACVMIREGSIERCFCRRVSLCARCGASSRMSFIFVASSLQRTRRARLVVERARAEGEVLVELVPKELERGAIAVA